jgi:hypothetical protein
MAEFFLQAFEESLEYNIRPHRPADICFQQKITKVIMVDRVGLNFSVVSLFFKIFGALSLIAMTSGCSNQGLFSNPSEEMVGTWQIDLGSDYVGSEFVRIFITPEGEFYIMDNNSFEDKIAYKVPIEKVSSRWQPPEDLETLEHF